MGKTTLVVSKMPSVHQYDTSLSCVSGNRFDLLPNRGRALNADKGFVPFMISQHASLLVAVKDIRLH